MSRSLQIKSFVVSVTFPCKQARSKLNYQNERDSDFGETTQGTVTRPNDKFRSRGVPTDDCHRRTE